MFYVYLNSQPLQSCSLLHIERTTIHTVLHRNDNERHMECLRIHRQHFFLPSTDVIQRHVKTSLTLTWREEAKIYGSNLSKLYAVEIYLQDLQSSVFLLFADWEGLNIWGCQSLRPGVLSKSCGATSYFRWPIAASKYYFCIWCSWAMNSFQDSTQTSLIHLLSSLLKERK